MGYGDRNASISFLWRIVDLIERPEVSPTFQGQRLGDGGR
jgi:hypothetical protein